MHPMQSSINRINSFNKEKSEFKIEYKKGDSISKDAIELLYRNLDHTESIGMLFNQCPHEKCNPITSYTDLLHRD